MQKILKVIVNLCIVYLIIYLCLFPAEGIASAKSALKLCLDSVLPALFPYLVCSGILAGSGILNILSRYLSPVMMPIFNVPGCGAAAFILGTVSGYPIGAVCVRDLYLSGFCTKSQADRMLAFCNNSGPVFIISVVGIGFLQSPHMGRLLYISHVLSAVLTGILLRQSTRSGSRTAPVLPPRQTQTKDVLSLVGTTIDSSVLTILKICGFVMFFSVFSSSLPKVLNTPILHSILEITGGLAKISQLEAGFSLKMALISFFIAFSGISVMLQVGGVISGTGLSLNIYIKGKLLQGTLSFFITKILVSKLPQTVGAFTEKSTVIPFFQTSYSALIVSLSMLIFGLLTLALLTLISALWQKHCR